MSRAQRKSRPKIAACGLHGLLTVAVAAATASAPASALAATGAAHAARAQHANSPAAIVAPGHWAQVTAPLPNNPLIPEIGLTRGADGVLHVLWTTGSGPWHIKDTPIAASGRVGSPVTIATDFLATDPDGTTTPSGVDAFWNGIKSNTPNSPQGTFTATRPRSGGSWSVSGSAFAPLPAVPDTSSSDTATTGSDGKPWFAYSGTDSMVVDHVGHPEVQVAPSDHCCFYNAGLAVDGTSGQTWLAYSSLIPGSEGIFARPLSASGPPSAPLTLSATRSSQGGAKVTFTVADAGTPVSGATVKFCGRSFTTPGSGQVTFRVASVSHGSATATAARGGYARASLKVRATC